MKPLLYLHGFTSGPASHKARMLAARLAELGLSDRFLCPQLPPSPAAAIRLAETLIAEHRVGTLVGSSLGGFYATYLAERHGLRAVLVNPAVLAQLTLADFVGRHTPFYGGEPFEFTWQHVAELFALEVGPLSRPQDVWLLVEQGDELLDWRVAVARYAGCQQTVLPGGDHGFAHWAEWLDRVIAFACAGTRS